MCFESIGIFHKSGVILIVGIVVEKCAKLCAHFSWETIGIPLEKYDNTIEIILLVLYLFLGIVGKYIVIRLEITVEIC